MTNAAKAAKVAHADLNQTIQAGLVVQQLHIKGAGTAAQTMGMFTAAMKGGNVSLNDITATLQGKAAVALQNYGVDLKSTLASMDVFAKAGIKGDSAAQTLTMSLNKLLVPSAKTDKILQSVGLTQDKLASDIRKPGGLATVFTELRDKAEKAGVSAQDLGRFYSQVFGARAGAGATLLLNNIGALQAATGNIGGANINQAFSDWLKNPEGAVQNFKTVAQNTLVGLGNYLLPAGATILSWVNSTLIPNLAGKGKMSGLFQGIAGALIVGLGSMKIAAVGTKIAEAFGVEAEILAGPIGVAIAAGIATALGINWLVGDTKKGLRSLHNLSQNPTALYGLKNGKQETPHGQANIWTESVPTGGFGDYTMPSIGGYLTKEQVAALAAYAKTHPGFYEGGKLGTQYSNAVLNFAAQDKKGNYSVVVQVK